jgi:hypothetical protein
VFACPTLFSTPAAGIDNALSTPKHVQAAAAKDIQESNFTLIVNVGDTSCA